MAYTASVSLDSPTSIPLAVSGFRILVGQVDITSYHSTLAEITDITSKFRNTPRVVIFGLSDNGYAVRWDRTNKAFKAFYVKGGTIPVTAGITGDAVTNNAGVLESIGGQDLTVTDAPGGEVANGTDVGVVEFIAFGR